MSGSQRQRMDVKEMSDFQISIITKTRKKHASLNYVNITKTVEESHGKREQSSKGTHGDVKANE